MTSGFSDDDWLSEKDLHTLVDAGQITPVADSPVARLANDVVAQLERTLSGLGEAMEGFPWQSDVDALRDVRSRIERLAHAGDHVALPALDRLLRQLENAGQVDFAQRLVTWCREVDEALAGQG